MNLLFEDMIRVETGDYVCRIWRQQPEDDEISALSITNDLIRDYVMARLGMPDCSITCLARDVAGASRVNSVEIIDRATGCGVCVHKDWP